MSEHVVKRILFSTTENSGKLSATVWVDNMDTTNMSIPYKFYQQGFYFLKVNVGDKINISSKKSKDGNVWHNIVGSDYENYSTLYASEKGRALRRITDILIESIDFHKNGQLTEISLTEMEMMCRMDFSLFTKICSFVKDEVENSKDEFCKLMKTQLDLPAPKQTINVADFIFKYATMFYNKLTKTYSVLLEDED